jgi:hypothetical protein
MASIRCREPIVAAGMMQARDHAHAEHEHFVRKLFLDLS